MCSCVHVCVWARPAYMERTHQDLAPVLSLLCLQQKKENQCIIPLALLQTVSLLFVRIQMLRPL